MYQVRAHEEGPLGCLTCLGQVLGRVGVRPGVWLN
jgi:hypothetical protein